MGAVAHFAKNNIQWMLPRDMKVLRQQARYSTDINPKEKAEKEGEILSTSGPDFEDDENDPELDHK